MPEHACQTGGAGLGEARGVFGNELKLGLLLKIKHIQTSLANE